MIFKEVESAKDIFVNLKTLDQIDINKLEFLNELFIERTVAGKVNHSKKLLFTSYFSSKKSPQDTTSDAPKDSITYIEPWYDSVNKLQLKGIVFHDGLSDTFVKKYSTQCVTFVRCTLGSYSLNDERFILYLKYIKEYCLDLQYVYLTDANDVIITQNPFHILEKSNDPKLFVGRNNGHLLRQSRVNWSKRIPIFARESKVNLDRKFYNQTIYNAGIIGGSISSIKYLLLNMCYYFRLCNSHSNNNMVILNYTIYKFWFPNCRQQSTKIKEHIPMFAYRIFDLIFNNRFTSDMSNSLFRPADHDNKNDILANTDYIVTSYPFCSKFKRFESESKALFIHK